MAKAESHEVFSPILYLKWKWKLFQCFAVSITPQPVYSPVLPSVQICCPPALVLGFLLDTERGLAHKSGDTDFVLVLLGNVALR